MRNRAPLSRGGLWLAVLFLVVARDARAGDRDAELQAALKIATRASEKIRNFSCVSKDYMTMDAWPAEAKSASTVERLAGAADWALMAEFNVTVDRVKRRYRYEGREFGIPPEDRSRPYFLSFNATFDGSVYRTYSKLSERGQQLFYRGDFAHRRSLHALLGDTFGGEAASIPGADLASWLAKPDGWTLASAPGAARPRLTRNYTTDMYGTDMRVVLELSPEHDYLPSLIETTWLDTETLCERYAIEEYFKVSPEGVWVPVRGRYQGFFREAVFPPGTTKEAYQKMRPEQKKAIDPQIKFEARPLTPAHLLIIDPKTIQINQQLKDSTFLYEFPSAARVFDEQSQQVLLGGKTPLPEKPPQESPAGEGRRWVLILALVVNVCLVGFLAMWLWRRRAAERKLTPG